MTSLTGLFFGPLPKLDELVAVLVEEVEKREITAMQPYCCREMIFTESRVILSPNLENPKQAFIICQSQTWTCPTFQETYRKLHLKFIEEVSVTRSLFQYCLSFTLMQRLAPLWNKAGDYFIQGRDFLESGAKLNAVCLDVNITDKICLGLEAVNLKIGTAKLEHFCTNLKALQHFATSGDNIISDYSIQEDLCFVLPSLKKGRVSSITHILSEDCPFTSYEDIRKHWKLMYGYRLPAQETVFYNVRFHFMKSKVFTYPASCIHSSAPHVYPRCDQQAIFASFITDLQSRLPNVCGTPFRLTSAPLYSTNRLHSASQQHQSNLTRSGPVSKQCTPFTTRMSTPAAHSASQQHQSNLTRSGPVSKQCTPFTSRMSTPAAEDSESSAGRKQHQTSLGSQVASAVINQDNHGHDISSSNPTSSTTPRIVPRFTSSRSQGVQNRLQRKADVQASSSSSGNARVVPSFSRKPVSSGKRITAPRPRELNGSQITPTGEEGGSAHRYHNQNRPVLPTTQTGLTSSTVNKLLVGIISGEATARPNKEGVQVQRVSRDQLQNVVRGRSQPRDGISMTREQDPTSRDNMLFTRDQRTPSREQGSSVRTETQIGPQVWRLPDTRPGLIRDQGMKSPAGSAGDGNLMMQTGRTTGRPTQAPAELCDMSGRRTIPNHGVAVSSRPRISFVDQLLPGLLRHDPFGGASNVMSISHNGGPAILLPTKRTQLSSDGQGQAKKPRQKAKVHENIDVRQMAIDKQLHKVNAATLIDWLRKHHIAARSKDKKGELVERVMNYVALHQHET